MSDMAGASTWGGRAAKLGRSASVSPRAAGLGLDRSPIRKPSAPTELMAWRASGTSMSGRESVKEDLSRARDADGLVELAGDTAALLHGAKGGEAFDALGAALLNA